MLTEVAAQLGHMLGVPIARLQGALSKWWSILDLLGAVKQPEMRDIRHDYMNQTSQTTSQVNYIFEECCGLSYPFEKGKGSLLIREAIGPEETLPVQDWAVADVSCPIGVLECVPGLVEAVICTTHTCNLQP